MSGAPEGGGRGGLKRGLGRGLPRWALFFLAWIALGRTAPADLLIGAATSALAAAASLRLMPAGGRPDAAGLLAFAARFFRRSAEAGLDVARRVFDPRLPLRPGFVVAPCRSPEGLARQALRAAASLQPGTLPLDDSARAITLHCLDTAAPVAADLAADEAAFLRALGEGAPHG